MSIQVHIKDLTPMDVLSLRRQIVLGSIYLIEYENDLGVDPKEASDFFDGYIDYLDELCKEAQDADLHWTDFDNRYNLQAWFNIYQ